MSAILGQRFGRLTLLRHDGKQKGRKHGWFRCDCGVEKSLPIAAVKYGKPSSCGCLRLERLRQKCTKHGMCKRGQKWHPLYRKWADMMRRCHSNSKRHDHKYYKDRGITVCKRWHDSENFIKDLLPIWKPGLEIDRIDNDGNYELANVRFVSHSQQMNNTRTNRSYKGKTISEWAEKLDIPRRRIEDRITKGWAWADALHVPAKSLSYKGHTATEWAKIKNIKYTTLYCRIFAYGWSWERALNTPVLRR